jgi:Tol biopolymer transport system component
MRAVAGTALERGFGGCGMAGARRALTGLVMAGALCLIPAPAAQATGPGENGRIAFSAARGMNPSWNGSLFSVNPDGTGEAPITYTAESVSDERPAWSPDGRKIAFVRMVYDNYISCCVVTEDIVIATASGAVQRVLTGTHRVNGAEPWFSRGGREGWGTLTWSPDGRRIAYGGGGGNSGQPQIWVINADDSGLPVRVSDGTQWEISPAWSPDGSRIALQRNGHLFTMSPTGADVRPVGDGLTGDALPDWSPDGRRLATVRTEGGSSGIAIIDANTGATLIRLASGLQQSPVWSPDGTRVAYMQPEASAPGDPETSNVYTIDAQGAGPAVRVTSRPVTGQTLNLTPTWQPRR